MGLLSDIGQGLDPTSDNFLGGGNIGRAGRALVDVFTFTIPETFRTNPYGFKPNTFAAKSANVVGGGIQGAFGGAVTGGTPGAVAGFVTGVTLAATKTTDPTTIKGGVINVGAGGVVGKVASLAYGTKVVPPTTSTSLLTGSGNTTLTTSTAGVKAVSAGTSLLSKASAVLTTTAAATTLATNIASTVKQLDARLPGTSGGSTGVTLNSPGPGSTTVNAGPSSGPNPVVPIPSGLQTISPDSGGQAQGTAVDAGSAPGTPKGPNYLLWGGLAVVAWYLYKKKVFA